MIKIHRCSRETDSEKADVLKEDLKKEKTQQFHFFVNMSCSPLKFWNQGNDQ